ncbi:MAG: ComF family protein [Spartobacteria bacterium]|nr:ComF family protein [Spartobacteria bacterium]
MSWALLDMLFSRVCEECGAVLAEDEPGSLCWDCRARVRFVQVPFCERCGDPVPGTIGGPYECAGCRGLRPAFDWARSAVRYEGPAKACIRRFKYQAGIWLQEELVGWLAALWRTCPAEVRSVDFVAGIPLYPRRERERGYNQAALLAEGLAERVGIPFRRGLLGRTKPTATQTHLTAVQRVHNVKGVFSVRRPGDVRGARIALVDDVMTTGATANECARALKAAGAAAVMVLTVARGG